MSLFVFVNDRKSFPLINSSELKTHWICHMKVENGMVNKKKREGLMDPIGEFYLPGYFCPAALIDSRETTQDKGRDRDNTERLLFLKLPELN